MISIHRLLRGARQFLPVRQSAFADFNPQAPTRSPTYSHYYHLLFIQFQSTGSYAEPDISGFSLKNFCTPFQSTGSYAEPDRGFFGLDFPTLYFNPQAPTRSPTFITGKGIKRYEHFNPQAPTRSPTLTCRN